MKILFDARHIRVDFHDGISRYSTELGKALARLTPVTFIVSDRAQLKLLPENAQYILLHPVTSPKEPLSSVVLNKYHPDVVISPMQTMGSIGRKFKLVLTVHDLIYYKYRTPPQQFSRLVRAGWRLYHLSYTPERLALNNADIIATISQTVANEIAEKHLTKRPVVIVPNAARDLSKYLEKPIHIATQKPQNLVYMGAFIGYKNVETLIKSMEYLPERTLHLLSRISPSRKAELMKLIPAGADIVFHGGVTDEEYANLLADGAIMVSASRAEGYGLPLAEALSLGVPAVVSDIDIFHEVAGDGALYADPDSPKDFADKINSLDAVHYRKELAERGKHHISQYSWDKSAQNLLDAINNL